MSSPQLPHPSVTFKAAKCARLRPWRWKFDVYPQGMFSIANSCATFPKQCSSTMTWKDHNQGQENSLISMPIQSLTSLLSLPTIANCNGGFCDMDTCALRTGLRLQSNVIIFSHYWPTRSFKQGNVEVFLLLLAPSNNVPTAAVIADNFKTIFIIYQFLTLSSV